MNYYYCLECGEIYQTQGTMIECGQCSDCDIMSIYKEDYLALLNDDMLSDIIDHSAFLTTEEEKYLDDLAETIMYRT